MKRSEALNFRSHIETAVQSLPVSDALQVASLHPKWEVGKLCEAGKRYFFADKLYEVLEGQTHTAQADWSPDVATSIFKVVNETHVGTLEDPIPYDGNMALENGKYYIQNNEIYLCNRDTVNPVYNALADLVGLYVVEV